MIIALDSMGGDNAPGINIDGAVMALERFDDVEIILTGDEAKIKSSLYERGYNGNRITVVHAPDEITMHDSPTGAVREKPDSSMVKAISCVADGSAEAVVSAGNTGALLVGATLIIKRTKGIQRPALASIVSLNGKGLMLLDVGANTDCKPQYLEQFGVMGSIYMSRIMNIEDPRVAIISNGQEKEKGNELTKAAYELLSQSPVNFTGNAEGRDIFGGDNDVFVCDGFTGNVIIKTVEGLVTELFESMKDKFVSSIRRKMGAALLKSAFRELKRGLDYTEVGGSPLLGINGGVIKAHGSSNAKAICNAIGQARNFIMGDTVNTIANEIMRGHIS